MPKYWSRKKQSKKKKIHRSRGTVPRWQIAAPIVLVFVFSVFFIALPLLNIKSLASKTRADTRYLKDGFLLQDFPQIKRGVAQLEVDINALDQQVSKLGWLSAVPFVRDYYLDGRAGIKAGQHLLTATDQMLEMIGPLAESLGFKTETSSIVAVGGQERLAGLVQAMPVIADQLNGLQSEIIAAGEAVERVEPRRYPERLGGYEVRRLVTQGKDTLTGLSTAGPDLEAFLKTIPAVMGMEDKKIYLVLFQNDKEIRPTGGFWTAYALMGVDKGRLVSAQSGDMYFLDIDNRVAYYPPAPAPIANYLKMDKWYIRDSNLSPDYPTSVETLLEFWDRVPGVPKIDGVFAIDTYLVESLLSLVGEISIPGYKEPFTDQNVVHQLEVYSNVLMKHSGTRKDILGSLMNQIVARIFALPTGSYSDLLVMGSDMLARKHALLYFIDPSAQILVKKYKVGGAIEDYDGDYLHINDANFGGRKANWYMQERVEKIVYKEKNQWRCDLTIEYENTGEYNSEWNTGYRDYVRVFVPAGSKLISGSGGLEPFVSFNDLGKTVFASFIGVNPKQTVTIKLTYQLPNKLFEGEQYRLLVQKQAGTEGFEYRVRVGKKSEEFILEKDTEIELPL